MYTGMPPRQTEEITLAFGERAPELGHLSWEFAGSQPAAPQYTYKGDSILIQINQVEANKVRAKYPDIHIRRTANKYYVEEVPKVLILLGRCVPNMKGGARYGANKAPRRKQS